jgi:hypothetical protein
MTEEEMLPLSKDIERDVVDHFEIWLPSSSVRHRSPREAFPSFADHSLISRAVSQVIRHAWA